MNQKLLEHYRNPYNFGKPEKFDLYGKSSNRTCGDEVEVYIKLGSKEGIIQSLHFSIRACALCKASSSIIAMELEGKSESYVKNLTGAELKEIIGGETPSSRHSCILLPLEAIQDTLKN
ncbi:MAG: iron-sulfur cluster assembly scaffold protein [Candidatus Dojkabacteria bacterium]